MSALVGCPGMDNRPLPAMGLGVVGRPLEVQSSEGATIYHVPGHWPLQAPGNDAANALTKVCSALVPPVLLDTGLGSTESWGM